MGKKTHEQYVQEVYDLVGEEYTVSGTYLGAGKKIKMKHNLCGHVYEVRAADFVGKAALRCPNCRYKKSAAKLTKPQDIFQKQMEKANPDVELLTPYVNSMTSLHYRCKRCGQEWTGRPNWFIHHPNCPKCQRKNSISKKEFLDRLQAVHGEDYEVIGPYINMSTKIRVRHMPCGTEFETYPNQLSAVRGSGCGCPVCERQKHSERMRKPSEQFSMEVWERSGGEYEVIGPYQGTQKPVLIRHTPCNTEYLAKEPSAVLNGSGCKCPVCTTKEIIFQGKVYKNTKELCKEKNVCYQTFRGKYNKGASLAAALYSPRITLGEYAPGVIVLHNAWVGEKHHYYECRINGVFDILSDVELWEYSAANYHSELNANPDLMDQA